MIIYEASQGSHPREMDHSASSLSSLPGGPAKEIKTA